MNIYQEIVSAQKKHQKLLAVLIDPEKVQLSQIHALVQNINESVATHIFVGGSTDKDHQIEAVVIEIKKYTILPVILFPGNAHQVTSKADGILFLSLLSGRNPEYLIQQQVDAALKIQRSTLEVLPTGYILIDGGKETSVQRVSQTSPIAQTEYELILKTALAGQFSGKQLIYLEAGSGADHPVSPKVIHCIKRELQIPLMVGGGIRSVSQLQKAYDAGADLVVIGTAFENDSSFFDELKSFDFAQDKQIQLDNLGHHL